MTKELLVDQLKKQLGFINRSCIAYDEGHEEDAIRIAVALRVLLHDTNKSISLFNLLGIKKIKILSSIPSPEKNIFYIGGNLAATQMQVIDGKIAKLSYIPYLGSRIEEFSSLPAEDWWTQAVYFIEDYKISRKDIILTAANKDGGAHVDLNYPTKYAKLMQGVLTFSESSAPDVSQFAPNAQYADLRQMGFEILSSPEIMAILSAP